jgi:hypothetical protein
VNIKVLVISEDNILPEVVPPKKEKVLPTITKLCKKCGAKFDCPTIVRCKRHQSPRARFKLCPTCRKGNTNNGSNAAGYGAKGMLERMLE